MKAIDALIELFDRVGACQGDAVFVNDEDLLQCPKAATKAMKSQKLIVKARPAASTVCQGCERDCVMPVHSLSATTGKTSSFIVCDKRSDVNRVPIPAERLTQWQCKADLISGFMAASLDLRRPGRHTDSAGRWVIGMVSGDKRSQILCLETAGTLNIVVGNSKVPLAEFIEFHDGAYSLDDSQIRKLADYSTTADDRYTPGTDKRADRKLATQAKYESWRKEYRAWRKRRPGMSDPWYSKQIAKMDIAQGRDSETIRKHMKK